MTDIIESAASLAGRYKAWLCDVWGVVHNGVTPYPEAVEALIAYRQQGGIVVFITNAPRPYHPVIDQLNRLGVSAQAYDRVLASGDVMRRMVIEHGHPAVHFLGPNRDRGLIEGLDIAEVPIEDAEIVLCTGLVDDLTETPEDYDPLLETMAAKGQIFYCANPDKVVQKGDRLLYCAGALADRYEALGGKVIFTGKPDALIYGDALAIASDLADMDLGRDDVLAIGDGMETDMRGAALNGIDALFVAGGIHAHELEDLHNGDPAALDPLLARLDETAPGLRLQGIMPVLRW
ncbi:HAD superfamily hydrolase (TIGR01459 family) [Rhodoligotrophos appendicifer]|uniref:TIGR01459 family HAD-type hydrolase n=1 Tax=Rhodoligotrophos appendicifer TaxID=987056 RepID=UPI001184D1FE|nr:TIGR01459 family HAD-type hydrolase [Rhodoligotrophos appendicifer]